MIKQENFPTPKGKVSIYRNNELILDIDNLVVLSGRTFAAIRLIGVDEAVISHMAVGSDNTAPVSGDTTLGTELGRVTLSDTTRTDNTISYSATFPAGTATGSLREAGLFNAASAGYMLARTTFPEIVKGSGDSISFVWNITL